MTFDQMETIVPMELTADADSISPTARIFYELNCSQKMYRELSVSFSVNGKHGSIDEPSAWKFVPPEGNGASLQKLLCR